MLRILMIALALACFVPACQVEDPPPEPREEATPEPAPAEVTPPPVDSTNPVTPDKETAGKAVAAKETAPAPKPEGPVPAATAEATWLKQLESSDTGLRFAAAIELGKAGNVDAVGPLATTLTEDTDYFVRRAAARSLGQLGSEEAVPALIQALGDKEVFVTVSAKKALETISGERFETAQEWSAWWAGQEKPKK